MDYENIIKQTQFLPQTKITQIIHIKKITQFLKYNLHNLYLDYTIGLRNYNVEEDQIGLSIKKLSLPYKFNINETFIFRSFDNTIILVYIIMENKFYIIKTSQPIIKVYILLDNYLCILYNNKNIEILNYKTFNSITCILSSINIEKLYYISICLYKNPHVFQNEIKIDVSSQSEIQLPILSNNINTSVFPQVTIPSSSNSNTNTDSFICEKIWSIYNLQTNDKTCYCFSIIEQNKRCFKYFINLNQNEQIIFDNILKLIYFLLDKFYTPIKQCTFLTKEE